MSQIELEIDEDIFTEVFYEIQGITERFRIVYGGSGSSKSFSVAQDEVLKQLEKKEKTLIIRKVATTLKDSVIPSIKARIDEFGLTRFYTENKKDITLTNQVNGSQFLFRGLDDASKLKSLEGVTRVVVEEADQLTESDFRELNRRIRGIKNAQITIVFNPVDEDSWLKSRFFDRYIKNVKIVHATYLKNPFLTQEDIDELEALKDFDENEYKIYALGLWGRLKTGGEFYTHYSRVKHNAKLPYIPNQPVHLTFDFNVLPYMTLLLVQISYVNKYVLDKIIYSEPVPGCETVEYTQIRFFKEYCLKSPLNSVSGVCQSFRSDYEEKIEGLFYYGDASGKNRIAGQGDKTNFKDVEEELAGLTNNSSNRVLRKNPRVLRRRDFIQKILKGGYFNIEILVDPDECPNLNKDFQFLKLGVDGKLKEKEKDPITKVEYEKYGHCTDAAEYLIVSMLSDLFFV
jgi:phage terminase large subunit